RPTTQSYIVASEYNSIVPSLHCSSICFSSPPCSLIEQIIPLHSIPRSFTFFILKLPGSTPPGFATTTFCPCATLGAPQIICNGSDSPTSTWQSFNLSAFGCWLHSC